MTNYEKLKTMSVQEAADTLVKHPHCAIDCAKEWLEREVYE